MKPNRIFQLLILCSLLFITMVPAKSQRLEVGIGAGGVLYWGDLSPKALTENFDNLRFGFQGFIRSEINSSFSARINLLFGKLHGDDLLSSDEVKKMRNLRFQSSLFEASLLGEFTFLKFDMNNQDEGLAFYAYGGLNIFSFNPTADYQGVTYNLQELGTEGQGMVGFPANYNTVVLGIPLGGGMKIKLNDRMTINPEIGLRWTFTDYIDDVSGYYVNYVELFNGNGPIAAALGNRTGEYLGLTEPVMVQTGSPRGGPDANDMYFVGMLNFTYLLSDSASIFSFGKKGYTSDCPTF